MATNPEDRSDFKCQSWTDMSEAWSIVYDAHRGGLHMRKKGTTYLEQFPREPKDKYDSRIRWRSLFVEFYKRVLKGYTGLVFANDPTPKEAPTPISELFNDIDLCGNDFNTFLMNAYEQFLRDGNGYFYVDAPPALVLPEGERPTLADVADRRPYLVYYTAAQLINYRYDEGESYLVQATLEECVTEPVGKFGEKQIIRHRILTPGHVEVRTFEAKDGKVIDADKLEAVEYDTAIDEIPLIPISEIGVEPPFLGIALLNILHYNKTSDFDDWCHQANVPQRVFKLNAKEDKDDFKTALTAGGSQAILIWGEHAEAKFLEVSGKGAEVTVNRIKDVESQMARLGLEKLAPINDNSVKTATEVDSDNIQSQSELAMLTRRFENGVEKTFYFISLYLNAIKPNSVSLTETEKAKLKLNIEYEKLTYSAQEMQFIQNLLDSGNISHQTFFEMLPNVVNMPEGWTPEEEIRRLKTDEPVINAAQMPGEQNVTKKDTQPPTIG